jgi:hypothetical protein
MYESVRQYGIIQFLAREAIPLALSFVIAEFFYKFHSFTLEALAFWHLVRALRSHPN